MASNMWVNGKQTKTMSLLDRGFNYGDGLFTTIKVINGGCDLLPQHIKRLNQGITRLVIAPIDLIALSDDLISKAKALKIGVLKVIITRGEGKRGYSTIGCDSPNIVIIAGGLPDYQSHQSNGIHLGVSEISLGINPLTAGMKHLNRIEQVLIKQAIEVNGWIDALVLDCQGYIVETSMANIFWRIKDVIYTPSLDLSGVNGLMRQEVIKIFDQDLKDMNLESSSNINQSTLIQDRFTLQDIINADEVFITNCLMGVVPILSIDNATFPVGELTKRLAQQLITKEQVKGSL